MQIRLHKQSHARHVLECRLADGTRTREEFESKSTLRHDLMHFALESRARLMRSFFGNMARGSDPIMQREMLAPGAPVSEATTTEILVGLLQGSVAHKVEPAALIERAREYLPQVGHSVPEFFTAEFVSEVVRDYALLLKRWNALETGGTRPATPSSREFDLGARLRA
jgi:hypothetical protein